MSEIEKLMRDDMLHVRMSQEAEERQTQSELAAPAGSANLNVGQLRKRLEQMPDDASICMAVLGHYAAPRRVMWCVKDKGVIITSD
jgi:hypothetical protein